MRASSLIALCGLAAAGCASPAPIPTITLGPDPADTRYDLLAEVEGTSAYRLDWYVDEVAQDDLRDELVPASRTERGQVWRVVVTSFGEEDLATASASVTIRNAPPVVQMKLAPDEPRAGDALVVAAVPFDADGDPLEVRYLWARNGQPVAGLDGDRVPVDTTRRGETWSVTVEANDGSAWSEPVSASVDIDNGLPKLTDGGITPSVPTATDSLRAWFQAEDPDGDDIISEWTWTVEGSVVQQGASDVLAAGPFAKGDTVEAFVRLSDSVGGDATESLSVGSVVIANQPPGRPAARIVPESPVAGDALRCDLAAPADDPDGDTLIGYRASWSVDGEAFFETADVRMTADLVPSGHTLGEQTWRCALQAFDGTSWGPAATASVEVAWDGFQSSQTLGGRTVTCKSVTTTEEHTTCTGLRVNGQAFPNGLGCSVGWSTEPSPYTDHAGFCALITTNRSFLANYTCTATTSRVTWNSGTWGSREDNGLTDSLRCFF